MLRDRSISLKSGYSFANGTRLILLLWLIPSINLEKRHFGDFVRRVHATHKLSTIKIENIEVAVVKKN